MLTAQAANPAVLDKWLPRLRPAVTARTAVKAAKRVPFAIRALLVYLAAITIFGKGPTYLGYPPIYWGEIVFGLALVWMFHRRGVSGLGNRHLRRLSGAILLFMAYGAVLTVISFPRWGLDACRDAALWYYAGFYFVGLNIARDQNLSRKVWRAVCCFWVAALLWGVCETLSANALSRLSPLVPWRETPVLASSHSELVQHMALGSIIVLCARLRLRSRLAEHGLRAVALLGFVLAALAWGRGVRVGLALGILSVLALNLHSFRPLGLSRRLSRVMALGALALILVVTVAGFENTEVGYLGRFEDISPASEEGNVYWRLVWWEQLLDELLSRNPLFGLGFGESLGVYNPYLVDNEYSAWPARAPHNVNVSVLARMGLAGLALWTVILTLGLGGLFRRAWRGGVAPKAYPPARREEIAFWLLMLITTWGNGSFGVLMEGPVLGIWFWFALGFASGRSVAYQGRPAVAARPRQPSWLPPPRLAENFSS